MAAIATTGRRRAAAFLATLMVGAMTLIGPAPALSAGPTDRLPDLRMIKPRDVQLVKYTSGVFAGRKLLRFTTVISNEGTGPLELRGSRDCRSLVTCPTMTVRQRIKQSDGTWRNIATEATMQYEVGDGHHHWHAVGLERYRLWPLGTSDPTASRAAKFGFCFFDTTRRLAGSSPHPTYVSSGPLSNPGCGNTKSLKTRVGLSPGWADIYPWDFSGQYIDVTGVPAGEYLLCVGADPKHQFLQSSTTNDEAWVRVRISGSKLTIRASKRSSCAKERARFAPTGDGKAAAVASAALAELGTVSYARVETTSPTFLCRLRA